METIQITLPDGAHREVPKGTTPGAIARQISPSLASEALVARVDGELVDLSRPLLDNAKLEVLTAKNADALFVFRHSAAHLLVGSARTLPGRKAGDRPAD
jgi:threonyl-tRNA synthetase